MTFVLTAILRHALFMRTDRLVDGRLCAFSLVFGMSDILSGSDPVNGEWCDVSASELIFMYFRSG